MIPVMRVSAPCSMFGRGMSFMLGLSVIQPDSLMFQLMLSRPIELQSLHRTEYDCAPPGGCLVGELLHPDSGFVLVLPPVNPLKNGLPLRAT